MAVRNAGQYSTSNGNEAGAAHAELVGRLLDAAVVGERDQVLDIGCGTGGSSRIAARRAPQGWVLGIDASGPKLRKARSAAADAGIGNLTFEQVDVQTHPFPEGRFDAAISHCGVMFFADPVAAFANVGRALRPGGRLAFVCPQPAQECEWYVVPIAALLGIEARPQQVVSACPGQAPALFSLSDPVRIRQVLGGAGFTDVTIEALHVPRDAGRTAAEAAEAFLSTGPARDLVERHPTLTRQQARARLTSALRPYAADGAVLLPDAQWLVSARWNGDVIPGSDAARPALS